MSETKNVLLIGGYGGLGYHVAEVFHENNWNVYIEDQKEISSWNMNLEEEFPNLVEIPTKSIISHNQYRLYGVVLNAIIFLAEDNCILNVPARLVENNVQFSTHIYQNLVHYTNPRLVVVGWDSPFPESSVLGKSINDRLRYSKYFNRGNNVISSILLPRLIGPYHHSYSYGNIVKRVYNALIKGSFPTGEDSEITIRNCRWIDSRTAAVAIYKHTLKNTRATDKIENVLSCEEHNYAPLAIARHVVELMDFTDVEFRTAKKAHNISKDNYRIESDITKMIEECIDVWDRAHNYQP